MVDTTRSSKDSHATDPSPAIALAAAAFLALVPLRLCAAPDIALQMTVDTVVPTAGQPVQFTITASNVGADDASGVQVTDQLPAELKIPTGMAAFPSTGTYDAATGVWSIGSLAAGANATLVIPAIVAATTQPPCSVNVAVSSLALDTQTSNNRAVAAVKRSAADRCVDLGVSANGIFVPPCSEARHLDAYVYVSNRGPDDASNVYVDLSQAPASIPGIRFDSAGCTTTRCTVPSIVAGAQVALHLTSDDFSNKRQQTATSAFATSSSDTDYLTTNNQAIATSDIPPFTDCSELVPDSGVKVSCFIATAAFGSPLEAHVQVLRAVPRPLPATQRARPRVHPLLLPLFAAHCRRHRRARLAAVSRADAVDAAGARDRVSAACADARGPVGRDAARHESTARVAARHVKPHAREQPGARGGDMLFSL